MAATLSKAHPAAHRGAIVWFLFSVAFTLLWFGFIVLLPQIQATGALSVVTRVTIHTIILTGLWLGLARTDFDAGTRIKVWLVIAAAFTAWLAVVWWLAVDGAFRPRPRGAIPALPIAIFLPLLVGLPVLLRSRRVGAILDATPASWLV